MKGLKCPNCGTSAAFTPIYLTRGEVFDYVAGTEEAARHSHVVPAVMPRSWIGVKYAILCCQDCERLFVVKDLIDGKGWRVVYPIPRKTVAKEIPNPVKDEFEEANLCFAIGAYRACAAMCQRTLESLCQNREVSGLNQLRDDGIISPRLFDRATEIRLWAGIVKHKPIAESVSKDDAEELLTYLDDILNHVYVEPVHYKARRKKRKEIENKSAKK